ncbi:MAG: NAD(P)-dependent oxidoreductase [Propionibacteriaceae bacterium]|nr:NAD(P)-dependent oxidoreductase [Propionibacteriaceae bacterium]
MAGIALIGLGRMGSGMASRLLETGHDLVVANRTPERAAPLVARGARLAATPAEAAADADAVIVMVSDDEASRAVWLGPDGVLAGRPRPGTLAIECSTLSHDGVLELADAVRGAGLRYVDAPVTGLPDAAAAGTLTLLVGVDPADLAAAQPVLSALSERVLHFGGVGTGTAYKLIVNLMGAVQIAGAAEGLALAERAGLDLAQVADAIASGQAASPQVVRNSRRMAAADHDEVVFSGRLRRKDAAYAMRFARDLGLGAPFGRVALDGLDTLLAAGLGDVNESAVIEVNSGRGGQE